MAHFGSHLAAKGQVKFQEHDYYDDEFYASSFPYVTSGDSGISSDAISNAKLSPLLPFAPFFQNCLHTLCSNLSGEILR